MPVKFSPDSGNIKINDSYYSKDEINAMDRYELQQLIYSVTESIGSIFYRRQDFIDNPKGISKDSIDYYRILGRYDKATISAYKNLVWLKTLKRKLDIQAEIFDQGMKVNFFKKAKELLSPSQFDEIYNEALKNYEEKVYSLNHDFTRRQKFGEFIHENFDMKKNLLTTSYKLKEDFTFFDGKNYKSVDPSFTESEVDKLKFFYIAGQKSS